MSHMNAPYQMCTQVTPITTSSILKIETWDLSCENMKISSNSNKHQTEKDRVASALLIYYYVL